MLYAVSEAFYPRSTLEYRVHLVLLHIRRVFHWHFPYIKISSKSLDNLISPGNSCSENCIYGLAASYMQKQSWIDLSKVNTWIVGELA